MNSVWNTLLFGNTIRDWSIAMIILIAAIIVIRLLKMVIVKKIKSFAAKTKTTIDDFIIEVVQSSGVPLLYVFAVYASLQYLTLSVRVNSIAHVAMMLATTFFLLRALTSFARYLFMKALLHHEKNEHREKQSKGILLIIQVIMWVGGFLFLIDNLGYDITTLIAGLGIGGIAIALAGQAILGDLFSYLVIFFDKPFEVGDFIIFDDKMGSVEYIGIKTTRIRTLSGEQLICANADLTSSRVHNYKRMEERRVVFGFGVTYNTPADKLKSIPGMTRRIIEAMDDIRFDRAHLKSFGASSLDFEVVYFIRTADFNKYMDIQQAINVRLVENFEEKQIEFAFPTQTIFLKHAEREQVV